MKLQRSSEKPAATSGIIGRVWSPSGLSVTVLCGLTLAFYHGLWLPGLVLIKRDAFRFFLPVKHYLGERLSTGELPQWFPYEALGRTFIGITHTGVFHPFTPLYLLFPVPDAYRVSTLLSCLLAALGAFALGRTLHFSHQGALLAGLAFALSGYVVSVTDNIVYLYSTCLLPLFCLALEKALRGTRPWVIAPAILWATVVLNGDVQTGYYYGFVALLWAVARGPVPYREAGLRLVLAGGLGALLAGVQLGPTWAVFVGSERAQRALFQDEALGWSTHPLRLLTVLAAPVGQNVLPIDSDGLFFGGLQEKYIGYFWAESLYLGIPLIGLAVLGVRHRRDLLVLTWLGGLALVLALGRYGGLYAIFSYVVPLWSAFRYPEKFMGIVSFAVAMLAGAGLDALRAGKSRQAPWLAGAALCAIAGIALHTEASRLWAITYFGASESLAHAVTSSAAHAFFFSAASSLGVWLVTTGAAQQTLREPLLPAVLLAIIMLDLSRANLEAYHTGPVEAALFTPPFVQALQRREGMLGPDRFRLVTLEEARVIIPEQLERFLGHYAAVTVARRHALDALHGAEFHLESARRYLTGYKAELIPMVKQTIGLQIAARYNVAYYIGSRSRLIDPRVASGLVADLSDFDLILFRNPISPKPRAYLSQQPETSGSPVNLQRLFTRPDFLSGAVDVIEPADTTLPGPTAGGSAAIERYAPEEVQVRVETSQSAVLILLDAFDKGWTSTLESGAELPILRANALVRAVVVPAGTHTITFRYETPFLRIGAMASLAGCLICIGFVVRERWRTRPN
jgi:hypothetical protein